MLGQSADSSIGAPDVPRVSVVVPTYQGAGHVERCLSSIAGQSLGADRFEVVVVINGPDDGTDVVVEAFREDHPTVDLRVIRLPQAGLALARNAGLAAAAGDYVTFVDDDDRVSPGYLEGLLAHAAPDVIAVAQVAEVDADGSGAPVLDNYVTKGTLKGAGRTLAPSQLPTAISFDAAKIVRTDLARSVRVDDQLRSGSDVVYWSTLANRFGLRIRVCPPGAGAVYFRSVRPVSHSRPAVPTYQFYVQQRLDVIERLDPVAADRSQYASAAVRQIITAQVGHMNRYVRQFPEEHAAVLGEVARRHLSCFPYERLNAGLGRDLVIAYSFLPATDTSALVTARRIRARKAVVDVISHDMSHVRPTDPASLRLVTEYVDRHVVVKGRAVTAAWRGVERFCEIGLRRIEKLESDKGAYRSVYSRAMWPASHVLAAGYKARHPQTPWTAEFSDPLRYDARGHERFAAFPADAAIAVEVARAIRARGLPVPTSNNLYEWIEHTVYALADSVVFTNDNQRDFMLGYLPEPTLRRRVAEVARVEAHPVPDPELYRLAESTYSLEPGRVHIGYFGSFYATRTLTEVTDALGLLGEQERSRIRLHVFTPVPEDIRDGLVDLVEEGVVHAGTLMPYLDFLALAARLDVLLVNDARTAHAAGGGNPYLPSKLSDYLGSGTPIWSIVEEGSPMSGIQTRHQSRLGDVDGAVGVLRALLADLPAGAGRSGGDR